MSSCVCYSAGFFGEHVAGGTKALDLQRKFTLLAFNCKFLVCLFVFWDYPAVMHCATLCNAVVLFLRFQKKKRGSCMSTVRTDRLRKEVVRRKVALVPLSCDR